jgi:phosphatidylglycerophosphate synthase
MNIIDLVKKIKKINKGQIYNIFSTEAFLRVVAWYVTPFFYYTKCSANTVSVIALIIGLSSSAMIIFFGKEFLLYGILIFILSIIVDHCDGNIARLLDKPTFFGRFMDGLFDIIVLVSVQASLIFILISDINSSNNTITLIIALLSLASTPIQHLIYDRYSAYARWISEEHNLKIAPTLRKEVSFKFIDVLNDFQIISLILIAFFDNFILIYFLVNLISSLILIVFHLKFAYKNMNVYAGNHRSKHITKNK